MPMIPASTTAGSSTADSSVSDAHHVVGALGHATHVDVERAEEAVAQPLDGGHRGLEAVDEPGPWLADRILDAELGRPSVENASRWGASVRRTRPIRRRRATMAARTSSPVPAVERPLVELVDLALDALDEEEVADEHLVDERRDEVAGGRGRRGAVSPSMPSRNRSSASTCPSWTVRTTFATRRAGRSRDGPGAGVVASSVSIASSVMWSSSAVRVSRARPSSVLQPLDVGVGADRACPAPR